MNAAQTDRSTAPSPAPAAGPRVAGQAASRDVAHRPHTGRKIPWIEWEIVPEDDTFTIEVYMAGGGCSLPGAANVLMPAAGYYGVVQFVFDVIKPAA